MRFARGEFTCSQYGWVKRAHFLTPKAEVRVNAARSHPINMMGLWAPWQRHFTAASTGTTLTCSTATARGQRDGRYTYPELLQAKRVITGHGDHPRRCRR